MTKIKVDTDKLKENSENILELCNSYDNHIRDLYKKIYNVPRVTKEWVGDASYNYAGKVFSEKEQYVKYGSCLKKMGKVLKEYALDVERIVKDNAI